MRSAHVKAAGFGALIQGHSTPAPRPRCVALALPTPLHKQHDEQSNGVAARTTVRVPPLHKLSKAFFCHAATNRRTIASPSVPSPDQYRIGPSSVPIFFQVLSC